MATVTNIDYKFSHNYKDQPLFMGLYKKRQVWKLKITALIEFPTEVTCINLLNTYIIRIHYRVRIFNRSNMTYIHKILFLAPISLTLKQLHFWFD